MVLNDKFAESTTPNNSATAALVSATVLWCGFSPAASSSTHTLGRFLSSLLYNTRTSFLLVAAAALLHLLLLLLVLLRVLLLLLPCLCVSCGLKFNSLVGDCFDFC